MRLRNFVLCGMALIGIGVVIALAGGYSGGYRAGPAPAESDTLQSVVNRGNSATNVGDLIGGPSSWDIMNTNAAGILFLGVANVSANSGPYFRIAGGSDIDVFLDERNGADFTIWDNHNDLNQLFRFEHVSGGNAYLDCDGNYLTNMHLAAGISSAYNTDTGHVANVKVVDDKVKPFSWSYTYGRNGAWNNQTNPIGYSIMRSGVTITNVRADVEDGTSLNLQITDDGVNMLSNSITLTTNPVNFVNISNAAIASVSKLRIISTFETGTVNFVNVQLSGTIDNP